MSKLPFQILELSIISGQDLAPVTRKNLRTYAILWINPERKLRTSIDQHGQINPTWNDKFLFRVDDKFLSSDTSAVMIEIYAIGWFRDIPVGSVRVLISNLVPQNLVKESKSSRRFVALQIRRPSGRPQGILNMGVTLLDNTMKSMPLYTELSASAIGYYDLMEGKNGKNPKGSKMENENDDKKPEIKLWRSLSDRTDVNKFPKRVGPKASSVGNGSACNGSIINGKSIANGSEVGVPGIPGCGNGSMCNSDVGPSPSIVAAAVARGLYPRPTPGPQKPGSSILEDWTVEESSVEGLKSKIERWRMDLPPINDYREHQNTKKDSNKSSSRRRRRHMSDGGGSLFRCFGNVCGCEFTIVCGETNHRKHKLLDNDSILNPSELYY